jgi:hypothetical protein
MTMWGKLGADIPMQVMASGMGMAGLLSSLHQLLVAAGGPVPPAEPPRRALLPADRVQWSFSNGNVIYHGGSRTPIDPRSEEGRTIESILARQRADRDANARQRAYIAALRQSATPRAVVEGRAGLDAIWPGPGLTVEDLSRQRTAGGIRYSADLKHAVSENGTAYHKQRGTFRPGAHVSIAEALRRGLASSRMDVERARELLDWA